MSSIFNVNTDLVDVFGNTNLALGQCATFDMALALAHHAIKHAAQITELRKEVQVLNSTVKLMLKANSRANGFGYTVLENRRILRLFESN